MDTDMLDAATHQCAHCVREQQTRQEEVGEMKQLAEKLKLNGLIPWDIFSLIAKYDAKHEEIDMKNTSLEKRK
jgi:hypothetical protein